MYDEKKEIYFSNIRHDIINLITISKIGSSLKILELGCGSGSTLLKLKELGIADEIVGIDIKSIESQKRLDQIIIGDVEQIELPLQEKYFDIIICADVLEHLLDPWALLFKLKKYLKDDGFLISSIPNIRNFKVLYSILCKGDFHYSKEGILDRTHLRFFCKKNIIDLFRESNFEIIKITSIVKENKNLKSYIFNKISLGVFYDFLVSQYLVISEQKK